nr:MAG TPA: hypothetical protein [Caudoviricetes sp.]
MAKIENYAMLLKTFIYHPKLSGIFDSRMSRISFIGQFKYSTYKKY